MIAAEDMTPIEQSHYDYITSEVIPMTDEQRAADHADISVRFAIEILEGLPQWHSTKEKINQLEKTLNNK